MQQQETLVSNREDSAQQLLTPAICRGAIRRFAEFKMAFDSVVRDVEARKGALALVNEALAEIGEIVEHLDHDDTRRALKIVQDNYRQCTEEGFNDPESVDECAVAILRAEQQLLTQLQRNCPEAFDDADDTGELTAQVAGGSDASERLLLKVLLQELQPIDQHADPTALAPDYLKAVVADLTAMSRYLKDSFLHDELKRISAAVKQCEDAGVLTELVQTLASYLQMIAGDEPKESLLSANRAQLKALFTAFQADIHIPASAATTEGDGDTVVKTDTTNSVKKADANKATIEVSQSKTGSTTESGKAIQDNKSGLAGTVPTIEAIEMDVLFPPDELGDLIKGGSLSTNIRQPLNNDSESVTATDKNLSDREFGNLCNDYVDVVQQALDTALGSAGNLQPDRSVVNALENLRSSIESAGVLPLLSLLEPLTLLVSRAEAVSRTLSQSDTLLVQEAIVALTLGIDALVNNKSTPVLVEDVASRITEIAVRTSDTSRLDIENAGLIDVYIEEADELLQRLFELFQRWRGAPEGGSRIRGDVNRLLHTLKGSAETVALNDQVKLVHQLESAVLGYQQGDGNESGSFFQLTIEAVELLGEDLDLLRENKEVKDHRDLIGRLAAIASANDRPALNNPTTAGEKSVLASVAPVEDGAARNPVFGSSRYFARLQGARNTLRSTHVEYADNNHLLHQSVDELAAVIQSIEHLRQRLKGDDQREPAIEESLHDLQQIQAQLMARVTRMQAVNSRQQVALDKLNQLVGKFDSVSAESMQPRLRTLVSNTSQAAGKAVELLFKGVDVAMPREIYTDLLAPLEQLLTNCVDHGIESAGQRRAVGKTAVGAIEVNIARTDNRLIIDVADDGAGIDINKLRKQFAMPDAADAVVLEKIIQHGVSSREEAGLSSGRGIGLDLVKTNLFRHRGTVECKTVAGKGTVFTLTLPETAVEKDVIVVEAGGQLLALPAATVIEVADSAAAMLDLTPALAEGSRVRNGGPVVCCRVRDKTFGLQVDTVVGRRRLSFVSPAPLLLSSPLFAGIATLDERRAVAEVDLLKLIDQSAGMDAVVPDSNRSSVLIVDDSVTVRASFGRAMVNESFEILLARNGVEALNLLRKQVPDAIVLDLEMPVMDGFELAGKVRSDKTLANVPLLVVTSRSRESISDWLDQVRADRYFKKPCTEAQLAAAVKEVLGAETT